MDKDIFYNRDTMYENIPNREKKLIKDVEELKTNGIPDNQARQGVADLTETVGEQSSKIDVLSRNMDDIVTVNLKVTNENDISADLKSAISYINSLGGGILNVPYNKNGYSIVSGGVTLCNNITINFNRNTIRVPSSTKMVTLFSGVNLEGVKVNDVNIISTNDYTRVVTELGVPRAGLGSNVNAFHLHGKNIEINNFYAECLEFGVQLKSSWTGAVGECTNIRISNYRTFKTKQPLFMTDVHFGSFSGFDFDLTDVVDSHDHHVYMNGNNKDLTFDRMNFKKGECWSFNIKSDFVDNPKNRSITVNKLNIEESWGIYIAHAENVNINDYTKKTTEKNRYAIRLNEVEDITINGINVDGSLGFLETGSSTTPKNISIINAVVKNIQAHTISVFSCDNVLFDNVSFIDMPMDGTSRLIYGGSDNTRKITMKNCRLITQTVANHPISLRGSDLLIVESCEFINNGTSFSSVMYNLSPSKVVAKGNYYKGFTNVKGSSDTATVEYDNIDLSV
jgi:hypothetical protein